MPMMKLRLATPEYLIDINDCEELFYITEGGGEVRIGAMTRHRELLESGLLAQHFPIFRDAEQVIADPVVRNRGTLGGSLCQADPSEDLSAVCSTLDASCVIRSSSGERVVNMEEFHVGPYETAVGPAEMLTEIRIPLRANGSSAYEKVERRAGDWAVVSAGAAVWMDGATIADGRVYAVDHQNHRVQVFDSSGAFLFMWGWGVDTGSGRYLMKSCANPLPGFDLVPGEGLIALPGGVTDQLIQYETY